jgi:hypothetical protein
MHVGCICIWCMKKEKWTMGPAACPGAAYYASCSCNMVSSPPGVERGRPRPMGKWHLAHDSVGRTSRRGGAGVRAGVRQYICQPSTQLSQRSIWRAPEVLWQTWQVWSTSPAASARFCQRSMLGLWQGAQFSTCSLMVFLSRPSKRRRPVPKISFTRRMMRPTRGSRESAGRLQR